VKRFTFLDWMRGLAVLIMFQCHAFNSFTRLDLRQDSGYVFSQFVGGMAAPLFLFMAGITFAFQMESLARREPRGTRRWLVSLRRAGYILFVAYLFRFTNWLASLPRADVQELLKVDILNCMGLAMAAFSVVALFDFGSRIRVALIGALAVASAAPLIGGLDWHGVPPVMRDYLTMSPDRGRFPFFPCAAYVGFGMAAGALVKRTAPERMDRLMQWGVLFGLAMILSAEYVSNLPYSIYAHSDFWRNSPSLILIRVGISLLLLAGAYLWTQFGARPGWSWMQNLGKTSLLVYWVHVMLVYGDIVKPLKRSLSVPQAAAATVVVTMLMVALAETRQRLKERRLARWRAGTTVAGATEAEALS
jgi:uncharacterized membrane protein